MKDSALLTAAAVVIERDGWKIGSSKTDVLGKTVYGECLLTSLCIAGGVDTSCWAAVYVPDALVKLLGPTRSWLAGEGLCSEQRVVYSFNDGVCRTREEAIEVLLLAADLAKVDELTGGVPRATPIPSAMALVPA